MIKQLSLINFKCFDKIDIPLNKLTLLAGANGSGKSTIIQALLLLHQSFVKSESLDFVHLYGDYIKIGKSNDLLYEYTNDNTDIGISLTYDDDDSIEILLDYLPEQITLYNNKPHEAIRIDGIFSERFEYIAAERISPDIIYPAISDNPNLGIHGQHSIHFLNNNTRYIVEDELCLKEIPNDLPSQVKGWLQKIFNGFTLEITDVTKADAVSLRYQEVSQADKSNEYRPVNVGFGITYTLPVILALLKAKKGDLIIIENPECHLHPKAQRMIGELIAMASRTGAQIIIETHSDHILNGIRLSVKKQIIDNTEAQILFVSREDVGKHFHTNVFAPKILKNGDIDEWPDGFFDEWDNALFELLK